METIIYKVALKHDNGTFKLTIAAASIADAVQKVMKSEGCPERAIISVSTK